MLAAGETSSLELLWLTQGTQLPYPRLSVFKLITVPLQVETTYSTESIDHHAVVTVFFNVHNSGSRCGDIKNVTECQ